jgi:NDP-sugar pyrophosphorylase family protein
VGRDRFLQTTAVIDFYRHTRGTIGGKPALASLENCPALILAGGLGTRLRAAFGDGPKSMAPVAGRHFLEYLLFWLRSAGIKDLILCVGYQKTQIQDWLGDGGHWGLRVRYSEEKELLGTAGALKLAADLVFAETCFVVNGDSFLSVNLSKMCQFHTVRGALATVAVARVRNSVRYGTVQLDRSGRITAFHEKSKASRRGVTKRGRLQLINGGVYLFQKRFFDVIPSGRVISLEKEIFPELLDRKLYGFATSGYFIDIGVPADFKRAQTELPKRFCA